MEIRKTTLLTETLFGETTAQAQMESAIPLPQGKTLERVLSAESEAAITDVNCRDGAIVVTGTSNAIGSENSTSSRTVTVPRERWCMNLRTSRFSAGHEYAPLRSSSTMSFSVLNVVRRTLAANSRP